MDLLLLSDISIGWVWNQEHFSVYATAPPLILLSAGFQGRENPSTLAKRGHARSGRLGDQEPKAVVDTTEHSSLSAHAQPDILMVPLSSLHTQGAQAIIPAAHSKS